MRLLLILIFVITTSGCSLKHPHSYNEASAYFDTVKMDTPNLVVFLNKFPKGADLHNHASGAAFIEFGLQYALENGYYFAPDKLKIIYPSDDIEPADNNDLCDASSKRHECLISVKRLLANPYLTSQFLDIVSMRGWHQNTSNGLDHFFNTFGHASIPKRPKPEYLSIIAARNYSQNVKYIELMTTSVPRELFDKVKSLLDKETFTLDSIDSYYQKISPFLNSADFRKDVVQYMDQREKALSVLLKENHNISITGDSPDMVIRYIPQLYRLQSNFDIFVSAAVNLKASLVDERIVAVNMVQNESGLRSLVNFESHMKILDYLWRELDKPNIVLHAGELSLRESPVEPMRDRISKSVTLGHASRIGHGVSIQWETTPYNTIAIMKDQKVAVEICLSSNDVILGISGKEHPFLFYLNAGIPITIATDDEAISRSNITMEYVRAIQEFDLSYKDIVDIARNGLRFSSLPGEGIYTGDFKIKPTFSNYLSNTMPDVTDVGLKAYLQIMFERDLRSFEKFFSNSNTLHPAMTDL